MAVLWVCFTCDDIHSGFEPFQGASQWYELQDLHVKEILPQMITLSDSYIQVNCLKIFYKDRHGYK